jgi:hypothetical protein
MKNINRVAVLSLLAIALTFGVTSCGKANLKKDLDGSWKLTSIALDGVDIYAQIGVSLSGIYVFDKKAEKCAVSITISSPGNPDENQVGSYSYKVKDKETIILEGETYTVEELTNSALLLSSTSDGIVFKMNFTK